MPHDNNHVAQLLDRARDGDEAAAQEIVQRYTPHLLRIVRRTLNRKMRTIFDSRDFLQAVWASFFVDLKQRADCRDLDGVAAYLGAMARNKTIDEVRRRLDTLKHGKHVEHLEGGVRSILSSDPTASQLAVVGERWEEINKGRTDRSIEIFEMRRQGGTFVEIAEKLGLSERTVRRVVDRAERRLQLEP